MNKIYKVIYSKVKQCYIVVSELAKSHVKSSHGSNGQQKAALTAAVLLALGTFSVASVFMPITAEAAQTKTDGSNFVGVERTDGLLDDKEYDNYGGKGANGADSITLGLRAKAGAGTITIGDRNAGASLGSVYVGQGDIAKPKLDTGGWATSIGYNSDATGYGSIALGSNAVAKNSYEKDSKGESLELNQTYVDNGDTKVRLNSKPDIQRASVAIGYGASADNGNIAIGSYSDASTDLRTVKDDSAKAYLTGNTADSYVSVGKTGALRRISNVADGAADSDAATIAQLKEAVKETDASKKANIDASNIGTKLKYKADGKTAADSSDITTNEDAWGEAIGTGEVKENNGQLVTGGTVYSALENQKKDLSVHAGWGIDIDKAKKNTISVKHNLGTGYADTDATGLILGGSLQNRDAAKEYGTATASSVIVGAQNALASNDNSVVVGGLDNVASGANSTVVGGDNNKASGNQSAVFGGRDNTASGIASTAGGGIMNVANGWESTAIGGFSNYALGTGSTSVGGYGKDYATGHNSSVNGNYSVGIAGGSTGKAANYSLAAGQQAVVTTENGTAIGYQATTDEANTIAFGHDAGDVSGYTIEWEHLPNGQVNADGTSNDYTKAPTVTENKYESAAYNRLVKAADGVEDHDAVVMEQLKNASNVGQNIKVYKTDENGNVQFDESNNPIEDKSDAVKAQREAAQKASEDAWGTAIGTGKIADPDASDKETNGSQQLVTGGTVYKALNGGMTKIVIGTPGENGKDGAPGTIGLVGPAGADGKNAEVDITIQQGKDEETKGVKGANGVDGKDGITRIVYKDAAGDHQVATMEDGLKFAGDDGQKDTNKVIAKKLNNTVDIIGGAKGDLTEGNIGVNNDSGKLKVQLVKDLTGITSISGSTDDKGAKITLDTTDKNISVNGGSIKDVATNLDKNGNLISGNENNAANMSDVQTLVQQGVDNGYANGDGITIHKDSESGKNVISINKGDGLKFDKGKLAVNTGDGLTIDEKTKAIKIRTSDNNLTVDSNGIGLSNMITIGTTKSVTIDGTKGEVSGLTNTTWSSTADYSRSTKAATESQVAQAMSDAVNKAGANDTYVAAGSYAVNDQHQISMNLVDKNNTNKGTVTITDVAKASEMGDVSKLADGVKNAGGKTTTVVDAINNVNTSMNTKIGDQNYSKSNTSGTNKYVSDGDSITSAIGKLDGAVQQATTAAGQHSTVSAGSNITVTPAKQTDGHTDYQVALNKDITVDSVTAKTATTDTLTVNNSATIGGVTIENKTISGLDNTEIEKDSKKAVNAGTIYNELRPTNNGSYIQTTNTTAQNLVSLDTQVKKTSDLINSDGKTIKIGGSDAATKVDVSGKDSSGHSTSRVITGVKTDANDSTSAASVGYVNDMNAANTQQIYHDMNSAYSHVENDISRAAAGSNALAALHPMQEFDPDDKAQYALGYGHYRNSNAGAVGVFYQPDENSLFSLGASFGNGDAGINAGVTFKFGPGGSGHHALTKTQMAKVIDAQSKEIDALKKDNADKDKRIDALEQKVNEILAKVEKDKA